MQNSDTSSLTFQDVVQVAKEGYEHHVKRTENEHFLESQNYHFDQETKSFPKSEVIRDFSKDFQCHGHFQKDLDNIIIVCYFFFCDNFEGIVKLMSLVSTVS